jgi:hypothetical protein
MTFLEPVIAALLGAGAVAVANLIQKNITAAKLLKYGPIVKKAYDIIDPVLDQNLAHWDGSKIDRAFEMSIETVADGKLSPSEVKKLALGMAKEWLPQVAADKVRKFESSAVELSIAKVLAARVNAES